MKPSLLLNSEAEDELLQYYSQEIVQAIRHSLAHGFYAYIHHHYDEPFSEDNVRVKLTVYNQDIGEKHTKFIELHFDKEEFYEFKFKSV